MIEKICRVELDFIHEELFGGKIEKEQKKDLRCQPKCKVRSNRF